MNDWTASQIRDLVYGEIKAERRFRDALRIEDRKQTDDAFKALDKALMLQAASYPTTKDFNELKTHVDERAGSSKGVITLFTVSSGLALIISVTVAILSYAK